MKTWRKINDAFAKAGTAICMFCIFALVVVIVSELINRNIFHHSFRQTIQVCGILFLWMAFSGVIPLYNESGLMRLDFLVTRAKGIWAKVFYLANKIFSLILGVVMVIAFIVQYPYVNTRFYSTFTNKVPYTVQYFPMALAGAFIALKTLEQLISWFSCKCEMDGDKPSAMSVETAADGKGGGKA